MPVSVTMPALGESVTEGTVTRWLKQEGEQVQADEPLLEVSTDKVDTEIPSPASGVLTRIVVNEDETVDVGTELAVIGDAEGGEDTGDAADSDSSGSGAEDGTQEGATAEVSDDAGSDDAGSDSAGSDTDGSDPDGSDADAMGGDAADRAVESAAEAEEADQPAEPAPAATTTSAESGSTTTSGTGSEAKPSSGGSGTSITMPALGESVTEGTVTRWLKSIGDEVAADEPLLEVSTDKVDTEIPSPVAGTLLEITVNEDETVEVGAQLATIGTASSGDGAAPPAESGGEPAAEEAEEPAAKTPAAETPAAEATKAEQPKAEQPKAEQPKAEQPKPTEPAGEQSPRDGVPASSSRSGDGANGSGGSAAYVTPLVRKLAAEHNVDLSTVRGTGVGGRIRKQDVVEAAKPAAPTAAPEPARTAAAPAAAAADPAAQALRGKTEKLSRLRTVIAKRMVESLQISAQLTTVVEVDITGITRMRDRVKADFAVREGVKLSFLPFFALAAVEALRAHPKVNSSVDMDAGTVTYHDSENLGIAVDTERGLLVPVIHGAGDLNLGGIARKIADLADRTRRNKITPDELSGGTFTLTNTGSRGALFDTPIINQPQSAILGTGTVVKRPVVIDHPDLGEIVTVRSMIYLALSYDHRIVDGADAARFLVNMKQRLEAGDFEAALGL
ncbi:MAG: 2-oxoglutarate dehydrogenase, E2 component, dihydrolipoamide succinyltransferase [Geodermatophilaceae bacterium]|nr:2-oxoglutarate dehydrogenase, E2 component, dihydrolipoamide succinyltransferase [Geodermatophilaceae bacterium]